MSLESGIIGHDSQLKELALDLEAGNVAHAYLFAGPPHVGKFTAAKWFARELLTLGQEGDRREKTLGQIERLIHPDVLVLDRLWIEESMEDWDELAKYSNVPQQHRSKAKAKTDSISIDDVRVIQDRLYDTGLGGYRVCLIRSVERLADPAANALLKILEEPPPKRVFLLTTQALSTLLPTIVSRTRVLRFSHLSDEAMSPLLKGEDSEDAAFLLHLSQGAPGVLRRLKSDPDELRNERLLHSQAVSFYGARSLSQRLKLLEPLKERGQSADRFLFHLALALREVRPAEFRAVERAFAQLVSGLETNAHRELLAQRFAVSIPD